MTTKTINKIVLILILCVTALSIFVGCNNRMLDTPELEFIINDKGIGIVNWDAISDADGYRVILDNDKETITSNPSFTVPERGIHTIKVSAMPSNDTKMQESKQAVIEIKYTTKIATPDVTINRYNDGAVKYVINNFDKDAKEYVFGIEKEDYHVTEDRGIIKAGLSEGSYDVRIKGIGDDIMTTDSDAVVRKVDIKPVVLHEASYVTKPIRNDFVFTLDTKDQDIAYVVADLYEIDARSYNFNKKTGEFVVRENILLAHATEEPQMIEVYFKDGNLELIEITIEDTRLADVDEYLSIPTGSNAVFSFDIFRNTLVSVEVVKDDESHETLVENTGYTIVQSGLKATITILNPNKETDRSLLLTFKKGEDEPYTRTIKYYFRESIPEVYNTHLTYNKADSKRGDLLVKFDPASAITKLDLKYALDSDYIIDNTTGLITIKSSYLDAFDDGALVTGRVYFGSDSSTFTIHVLYEDTPGFIISTMDNSEYTYQVKSGKNVEMLLSHDFRLNGVSFDGVRMEKGYGHDKNKFVLHSSFLDKIGAGRHEVRLHVDDKTTYDIVAHVNIDVVDITPSEISISIDNTYPYLSFNYKNVGSDIKTTLTNKTTGKTYDAVTGENHVLVLNTEFTSGDKYIITHERNGETKSTQEITFNAPEIKNYEKYYNAHFTYGGEQYDAVITSDAELETLVHYAIMRVSKMRAYDSEGIVTDPDDTMLWSTAVKPYEYSVKVYTEFMTFNANTYVNTMLSKIDVAAKTYKEPNSVEYKVQAPTGTPNECVISFRVNSTNVPYALDEPGHAVEQRQYNLGYESEYKTKNARPQSYDDFKINNWEKTQRVYLADELYYAIEDGARPVPVPGSPAEEMLDIIKDVNRSIIDDSMTDTEKYMAIYDWIVNNVTYDQNTADYEAKVRGTSNYPSVYPRRCFFLEGVFIDHIAVCNGLAKAVVVMAGLEGIESVKVLGYTGGGLLNKGARHAWIKVNIDGTWFNSDPTWGSQKWTDMPDLGELIAEGNNHNYTLVGDKAFESNSAHDPDKRFTVMTSNIDVDFFANVIYGRSENGDMNTLVINSEEDIKKAVAEVEFYAKYNDIVAIPVVGSFADMNTKFVNELKRITKINTWTVRTRNVTSKHGSEYRLLIFTKA